MLQILNVFKLFVVFMLQSAFNLFTSVSQVNNYLLGLAKQAATALYESIMKVRILVATSMLVLSTSASAAVPASVTAAITEAVTDVGVIGAAVLGVIIIIAVFKWLKRPINS